MNSRIGYIYFGQWDANGGKWIYAGFTSICVNFKSDLKRSFKNWFER